MTMTKQKEAIATPDFGVIELHPRNGRKSFYGKCNVITQSGKMTLVSYCTPMAIWDTENRVLHRISDFKSNTTSIHIRAFLDFIRMPISVKEFYNSTRIER